MTVHTFVYYQMSTCALHTVLEADDMWCVLPRIAVLSNDIRYHIKELILDIFPNIDMLYGACSSDSDTV